MFHFENTDSIMDKLLVHAEIIRENTKNEGKGGKRRYGYSPRFAADLAHGSIISSEHKRFQNRSKNLLLFHVL